MISAGEVMHSAQRDAGAGSPHLLHPGDICAVGAIHVFETPLQDLDLLLQRLLELTSRGQAGLDTRQAYLQEHRAGTDSRPACLCVLVRAGVWRARATVRRTFASAVA
ncbi:unnamed protein product [Pedinophyceae sp. YPF-701]|nr:unnamed protein product [Pedinophyceae sp. YPF-701]